jgi:hypothetical protein
MTFLQRRTITLPTTIAEVARNANIQKSRNQEVREVAK